MNIRFRTVHRYAIAHGYLSGYSTLEEGLVADDQLEYQGVLIPGVNAEYRLVKREDLNGSPVFENIGDMFRATHRYANGYGFETGFPSFEQGKDIDDDIIYGITMLRNSIATVRSVPASALGNPNFDNPKEMMIATHRYALNQPGNFVSGFPLFEQGINAGVLHFGIALINSSASFQLILADALSIFENFSFDPSISGDHRNKLLERHVFAINRITTCNVLGANMKSDLRSKYREHIEHGTTTDPGINAKAYTSGISGRGRRININFANLFPLGDDEISQTLIHEMMHLAGYSHPAIQNTDTPGDNGPYYGTPPLQAELCIAGSQSLVGGRQRDCIPSQDGYTIRG